MRKESPMTRHEPTALASVAIALIIAGSASATTTYVRLDVMTGDPNDPNAPIPLIEATGGSTLNYAITAIVYTNPEDYACDANITKGLGAAYVTLNSDFGDANLVGAPNSVNTTLGVLASTGLARGDDITDIGGSQDLLGSTPPTAFANGQRTTLAEGTITLPTADGVYRVWVTPQQVSVLEPTATQAPFGRAADSVTAGQGFYVVIGNREYFALDVVNGDPNRGYIVVEPDLPNYPNGISVSLTAVPYTGYHFDAWYHIDPNYQPEDPGYKTEDTNKPTTVVKMDQPRQVYAVWCGESLTVVPFTALGMVGIGWLMRRKR
jgi:hypothetical protein